MPIGKWGREARKGRQPACQMLARQLPWGQLEMGPAGSSGIQGKLALRTLPMRDQGPGTWGMDTSSSVCHWLLATLRQESINFGGAPILQHGTPIFFCENKDNFISL